MPKRDPVKPIGASKKKLKMDDGQLVDGARKSAVQKRKNENVDEDRVGTATKSIKRNRLGDQEENKAKRRSTRIRKIDEGNDQADGRSIVKKKPRNRRENLNGETSDPKSTTNAKKSIPKLQPRDQSSSSSESEWEDVADHPAANIDPNPDDQGTSKTIQITVNAPKTKKQVDMEGEIRRAIKRFKKALHENMHKAHLLCYIAYGRRLSSACNDDLNKAVALSTVPVGYTGLGKDPKIGKDHFKLFVRWLRSSYTLTEEELVQGDLVPTIRRCLETKEALGYKLLALCFVTTFRALGLDARIVINARVMSKKMESEKDDPGLSKKPTTSTRKKSTTEKPANSSPDAKKKAEKKPMTKQQKAFKTLLLQTRSRSAAKVDGANTSGTSSNASSSECPSTSSAGNDAFKASGNCDYWVEVYMDNIEKWICINCVQGTIDSVDSIMEMVHGTVIYCLAFDQDLALKDITSRYSSEFMSTQTRGCRLKGEWLSKTLDLFKSTKRMRNRLEDMQLDAKLAAHDLPSSIVQYKNHPLYVLKRDLKKFEGIYPANTEPIGFIKTEAIYPRSAVHMLHSKETWRKEALVVKENEQPYKVVKGRPKWDSATKQTVSDREVPVYGLWQTEPYKSKAAKDGIVPRNEYGNVELFKPSMLPPGTVHLELPGLLQVARKMDIDCAPAMVGWDFHGKGSHPVLNGWVVCEEYKDVLIAAWEEEQALAEQREIERRSKKALQNWRQLAKALLLREKLRNKFKSNIPVAQWKEKDESQSKEEKKLQESMDEGASTSKEQTRISWPQYRHEFTGNHDEEL